MNDRLRLAIKVVVALLLAGAVGVAYISRLYWRHIPARYLPFTRSLFYEANVNDEVLATLDDADLGAGEVTKRAGLPPCPTPATESPSPRTDAKMSAVEVTEAKNPVDLATQCRSDVIWVAEQAGTIRPLVDGRLGEPALDIALRLYRPASGSRSWEMGLESIAFSPDGTELYVSFSDSNGATRVSAFPAPPASNPQTKIDPEEERPVLAVGQPDGRHNGGTIRFGPNGHLYFGLGDGGLRCGIMNAFPARLYGTILRIDPRPSGHATYGIPADNPFVGADDPLSPRPEVWLTGIRNPWGFSVDRRTGAVWVSDVGEFDIEELTFVPPSGAGSSLGWPAWEGTLGPREECIWEWEVNDTSEPHLEHPRTPHTPPTFEYEHDMYGGEKPRCSITGGEVYRGPLFGSVREKFLFGDFCSGEILAIGPEDSEATDTGIRVPFLTSITVGPSGEIWASAYEGPIVRIRPATTP